MAISPHLFIGYLAEPCLVRLLLAMHSWTLFLGANTFFIKQALQKFKYHSFKVVMVIFQKILLKIEKNTVQLTLCLQFYSHKYPGAKDLVPEASISSGNLKVIEGKSENLFAHPFPTMHSRRRTSSMLPSKIVETFGLEL